MTATIHPVPARVAPDDDLTTVLLTAVTTAGLTLADGDVVAVASKVVALTEGRLVPLPPGDEPRRQLARDEASAIVADAPWVLITRTHHGFVSANAGIDQSNVPDGTALLLPTDPDASAAALRNAIRERTGADVGVLVTDTFGRPWREGQTDVALGVAGIAGLRDERGGVDLHGRPLDVTVAAVADQLAGAADLVRTKAAGIPFVVLRGFDVGGEGTGADLIRDLDTDLFRWGGPTAVEQAVAGRRTIRAFTARTVDDGVVRRSVEAMVTAPAPHHTRPWRVRALTDATRTRLLDAMADAWRRDLSADGVPDATIARRLERSDAVLRLAPVLLAAFVDTTGSHTYPDAARARSERDLFLLAGGAGLQNLMIVAAGHGVGTAWMSSITFCANTVRDVLGLPGTWEPLGMVAMGHPAAPPRPRAAPDATDHWAWV